MKTENNFEGISFRGHFRDFQRQILRKADNLLDDSRINLITAPCSDKKLLGLEMIRRMGNKTVIITASENISARWAACFRSSFLPASPKKSPDECISTSLMVPSLITIITFDTLAAAIERRKVSDREDYTSLDLIRMIQQHGIRTVCLDEPHHLSEANMRALETLLGILGGEVHVLSLSSVPPYDLPPREWNRFITLCGEISEEIYTPELVKAGILAPHQDYVYLNYPSEEESAHIRDYRLRVDEAIAEAMKLSFMSELNHRIVKLSRKDPDFLYSHYNEMLSLLMLLAEYNHPLNPKICRIMTRSNEMPHVTLRHAQTAINFLLESLTLLRDSEKEELSRILEHRGITEHGRAILSYTSRIHRTLAGSVSKPESAAIILEHEDRHMGNLFRALVVTDEKSEDDPASVNAALSGRISPFTTFESIRKRCPRLPVGCMTSNIVILPDMAKSLLISDYGLMEGSFSVSPIKTDGYARFTFHVTAENVRRLMSHLLDDGIIRVLVATETALGSEWTMPCVNTLVPLCSAYASVTVPRMRGNVLLMDRAHSEKTLHIWHIATVERAYPEKDYPPLHPTVRLSSEIPRTCSPDYDALRRRFNCFIAPNEATGELENGLDRLLIPNENPQDIAEINTRMMESSADRSKLKSVWTNALVENTRPVAEVIVPKRAKVPVFTLRNAALLLSGLGALIFASFYAYICVALLIITFVTSDIFFYSVMLTALVIIALLWGIYTLLYMLPWFLHHLFPRGSIRSLCTALLRTLQEQGEISPKVRFIIEATPDKRRYRIYPDNCTVREQTICQKSVSEMFSPIDTPSFIMVRAGMIRSLRWRWSFACPEIIGQNDISVKIFERHLRRSMGLMKFQFTLRDPGRKYLIIARNKSYLNYRDIRVEKRLHVLKHDRF